MGTARKAVFPTHWQYLQLSCKLTKQFEMVCGFPRSLKDLAWESLGFPLLSLKALFKIKFSHRFPYGYLVTTSLEFLAETWVHHLPGFRYSGSR